jgi:DNA repair exonuclease SbcCD nuclease subunit
MASEFFKNLEQIAPTYIILGNHDGNLKNASRQDALTPIVNALDLPNLHLLKNSGEVHLNDQFCLNVLSVFDEDNWISPTNKEKINIALYHGAISGAKTELGWVMENGEHDLGIFKDFDFGFLGDIHRTNQIMDLKGRIRYPGSTIQQNHGETDDKGFLIWTIEDKYKWECDHFVLKNPRPFQTIELDKKGKIPSNTSISPGARLRLVSTNNLPLDTMRKAVEVAKHKFKPESISFLNRAVGERLAIGSLSEDLNFQNLRDPEVQQELISEYLKDYEVKPDMMSQIYELNNRYNRQVESAEDISRNVNWKLIKFEWSNLFNYGEKNSIDFRNTNGIIGIFGKNFSGKSSIIDAILFTLFNTTSKNERKNLNVVNQNKDWGEGKLTIQIDSNHYTIHRKLIKHIKNGKDGKTTECKTELNFSVYDPVMSKTKSLNGTTRAETDRIIRRQFGIIDDFLVSSMSSQDGALAFINEGSTKRKEIIAKFLDLKFFDKKFKLAKEDSIASKALVRKLSGIDYEDQIKKATVSFEEYKNKIEKLKNIEDKTDSELSNLKNDLRKISEKIFSIPNEPIDINKILNGIEQNSTETKIASAEMVNEVRILNAERKKQEKILEEIKEIDYTSLKENLKIIEKLEKQISRNSEILKAANAKKKLLEGIPCGDSYPSCKFICDAHKSVSTIKETEDGLQKIKSSLEDLEPAATRSTLDRFYRLEERKFYSENLIKDLAYSVERNKIELERLHAKAFELNLKKEEYNKNKDAIENLEKLIKEKENHEQQIESLEQKVKRTNREKINLYKLLGSKEQEIENIKKQKEEFEKTESEYASYDLFLRCMHPSGIAYDIIKKKLPVINEEVAKILSNIVNFEIFFETNGNKLDIFIKHSKHEARPIEMASGAEKSMAAMAIRLALLSVSSLPTGDLFVLDEPGTALDEENMAGFIRILELIKVYFKNVLLVSHLDSLKDCVDMQIVIEKNKGFAKVNQ